jgi:hypothetical protein
MSIKLQAVSPGFTFQHGWNRGNVGSQQRNSRQLWGVDLGIQRFKSREAQEVILRARNL